MDYQIQINRLCVVCQDTASGIHYRVLTCEGCKGFWRRTIQRGMGPVYQCRQGAERCAVTPQSRGRCQRCRYLACVAAGMVADLVMSDRERIVKAKEVVNNRVRKEQPELRRPVNSRDQEGQRLLTVAAALHQRFLATREVLGENQNIHKTIAAASNFLELFLAELMGGRFILELMKSAHMEVVLIHLAVSRPASSLAALPLLAQLADHASSLTYQEVVLAQAVAATRPRLSWPPPDRYKLGEIWDILAEAVRRWSGAERLPMLLQLVMQAAFACCYIPQETLVACLQPRPWAPQGAAWGHHGWNYQGKIQGAYPGSEVSGYQEKSAGMYLEKGAGIYSGSTSGVYPEKAGMYPSTVPAAYSSPAGGNSPETGSYDPEGSNSQETGSYVPEGSNSPESIGIAANHWQEQPSPGTTEEQGIVAQEGQGVHVDKGPGVVRMPQPSGLRMAEQDARKRQNPSQQEARMRQPPSHLATIYKEVDYDVYGNTWHGGGAKAVKTETQAGAELRPVPDLQKIEGVRDDVIVPDNVIVPNVISSHNTGADIVTSHNIGTDLITSHNTGVDMITSHSTDFVAAQVSSEELLEPASKKRKFAEVEEEVEENEVLRQDDDVLRQDNDVHKQNNDVLKQALLGVF